MDRTCRPRRAWRHGLAALGLFALPAGAVAAHQRAFWGVSIEHGLPQSQVRTLRLGPRGHLWVGMMGGGLARFDGRSFQPYTMRDGLPGDEVTALAFDAREVLWIGTNRGVAVYDGTEFRPLPSGPTGAARAILPSGPHVWVGSAGGLARYHAASLTPAPGGPDLGGIEVLSLLEDRAGRLWIGTASRGLARWEGQRIVWVNEIGGQPVRALLETRDGRIWIGTDAGPFVHDGARAVPRPPGGGHRPGAAHALLEDGAGNVWVGTEAAGACRYRSDGVTCFTEADGLGSDTVWALGEDGEGALWAGTYRGGLARFRGAESMSADLQRELGDVVIRGVLSDRRGRQWFATDDRGVLVRETMGALRWLRTGDGLAHSFVLTLYEDRRGAVWLGTREGLSRYQGGRFRTFGPAEGLPGRVVRSVVEDAQGALWIGTNEEGVARWDGRRFQTFGTAQGLNAGAINQLYADRAGRLWAGTQAGLNLLVGDRFVNASRELGITQGAVYALAQDPVTADLWLAVYGEGLVRVPAAALPPPGSASAPRSRPAATAFPDLLWSDRPVSLLFGDGRDLWVGTEAGIERLRLERLDDAGRPEVGMIGATDGPGRIECIHLAVAADAAGRIWFGTLNGPLLFDPRQGPPPPALPRVFLTAAGPAPGDWSWTGFLPGGRTPQGSGLTLDHDRDQAAFAFEAVSLRAPSRVRYQYRLDGLQAYWSPATATSQAFFPRLPPGGFSFRVRASTDGRTWVEAAAPFRFHVRAPFWRQGWFYALGLGALALSVYAGHRFVVSQLDTRRRELQAEVEVRQQAEAELRRTNRALRVISDCNQALVRAADEGSLLREVCDLLVSQGGYRMAWVGYPMGDAGRTVRPVCVAGQDEAFVAQGRISWADTERGRGPTGTAIRVRRPVLVRDVATDPDFAPWREAVLARGIASCLALPLLREDEALGCLTIYATDASAFDREQTLLAELADDLAYGIAALRERVESHRAQEALQASEVRFRALFEQSVDAIGLSRSGIQVFVNPAYLALFGYPDAAEVVGRSSMLIVAPEQREEVAERARRRARGEAVPTSYETVGQRRDGTRFDMEVYVSTFPLAGETYNLVTLRDISGRKRAQEALSRSERRFRALIENSSDVVCVVDDQSVVRYASPSIARILGHAPDAHLGRPIVDLVHPDDRERTRAVLDQLKEDATGSVTGELRWRHGDGQWRWLAFTGTNLLGEPSVNGLVLNYRDVTAQKRAEAQLQHDALHDALTGLPNRALFMERLERVVRRAQRNTAYRFGVLFIDLDRFKLVNDSLGHDTGDQLLVALAPRLLGCLRASDTCARLGGDEFVILLDEIGDVVDAAEVAERIQQQLRAPFSFGGRELAVSGSVGIVVGSSAYQRPEEVLRDADIAMYRAKAGGRSRHEVFDVEMRALAVARLELETALHRALERRELRVYYQPIVNLRSGQLQGFEALVRWHHPQRGVVLPDEFVPVAEDGVLIVPLDRWVLREACRQMREWREVYPALAGRLVAHVNLSGRHFAEKDLAGEVHAILRETGLDAHSLKIEITESTIMGNLSVATGVLQQLHDLGVQVAIDDFGTGYSSLSYLVRLPVDTLKIDRSFVGGLAGPGRHGEVVQTILALGRSLRLAVIAEGVETPEQQSYLRSAGCELGQGNLISVPLSADAASGLLAGGPEGKTVH